MRLLAWNIQQGGGKRADAICRAVSGHDPDVVVLSEFRSKSSVPVVRGLADAGWRYCESTNPTGIDYGLCVASRTPLAPVPRDYDLPDGGVRWLEVGVPEFGFEFAALHIRPAGSEGSDAKRRHWDAVLHVAVRRLAKPFLFVGDLNTGKHRIDEAGRTFHCADQFEQLEAAGWIDAWRHFHGVKAEFSWYSRAKGGGRGKGFRLDHAFVSPLLLPRVRGCWYSHREREEKISDHSVQLLEIAGQVG